MSSIISNRKFLVKNPNEIIQESNIVFDIPSVKLELPKIVKKAENKYKYNYFIKGFYI